MRGENGLSRDKTGGCRNRPPSGSIGIPRRKTWAPFTLATQPPTTAKPGGNRRQPLSHLRPAQLVFAKINHRSSKSYSESRTPLMLPPANFKLHQPFPPSGDQPEAIAALVEGFRSGEPAQVLLGATGTGK